MDAYKRLIYNDNAQCLAACLKQSIRFCNIGTCLWARSYKHGDYHENFRFLSYQRPQG